jgi:hypothetical protein
MIELRWRKRANTYSTRHATIALLLPLSLLVSCCGCGSDGVKLVPAAGVVTLDGNPMPGIQVTLDRPELGANENRAYVGVTDSAGRYSLRAAGEKKAGVPPSEYRVSLTTVASDPNSPPSKTESTSIFGGEPSPPPERVPRAYRGGKLKFTVPVQGTEIADFALTSK